MRRAAYALGVVVALESLDEVLNFAAIAVDRVEFLEMLPR